MKSLKENFQKAHIVIIGSGIIGKFNALELSELGFQVTIIDPAQHQNSSNAALGLLMGNMYQKRRGRSWDLRKQSIELWPQWITFLQKFNYELNIEKPFTWSSGIKSPIYCDNRILLSDPESRNIIANYFSEIIKNKYDDVQLIAGVATGAIGIGILVAQKLDLPFIYVRPEAKKHGRKNQIEGKISENQKIVVIEDLIITGKSSLNAIKALRKSNLEVLGMIAIFTYGLNISVENLSCPDCSSFHFLVDS